MAILQLSNKRRLDSTKINDATFETALAIGLAAMLDDTDGLFTSEYTREHIKAALIVRKVHKKVV